MEKPQLLNHSGIVEFVVRFGTYLTRYDCRIPLFSDPKKKDDIIV